MIENLFKDMFKYIPAQIVPGIVSFISIPIITRLFQPEEYGNYILVMATVSVFYTIVGWLYMPIIRFYPAYDRDKKLKEFYGTVLKLTILSISVLSLIYSGLLLFLRFHISERLCTLMWIGLPVFIMTSCFFVLIEFFRAERRIKWYSIFKVWKSISAISFGILLVVALHFGIEGLLLGSLVGMVFAFPFLLRKSIGKVPLHLKNIYVPLASELAKYGFPLVIGNLAAWILSLSDRYVLKLFRGSQEVGIYSASYAISERSIMLISTLFALTTGSIVYNIWEKEGKKKSQEFVGEIARYYLLICTPAAVGLSVLAKPIIVILTGQEYHGGNKIISIVVFGVFFFGLQQLFYPGFGFYKKTHFIMLSLIVSGLVNLGLNFLLIPRFGYIAAAATTLISYTFQMVLVVLISRRFFIWKFPFRSLVKVICASVIMGFVIFFLGNDLTSSTIANLLCSIVFGFTVYFVILYLFGEFNSEEKDSIRKCLLGLKFKILKTS